MTANQLFKRSLEKAMALCAGREYCASDIRGKLKVWGISDSDAEKIITHLQINNFINDARYASAYASDKFRQNKWGKIKITMQLRAKSIPEYIINEALGKIPDDEYLKTISEVLASHRRLIRAKNTYELKSKLIRFGLSKGFENHLLYDLLDETD